MNFREKMDYARLIGSFAMAGAVTVGTLMLAVPVKADFDVRIVGAGIGALIAIKLFGRA